MPNPAEIGRLDAFTSKREPDVAKTERFDEIPANSSQLLNQDLRSVNMHGQAVGDAERTLGLVVSVSHSWPARRVAVTR